MMMKAKGSFPRFLSASRGIFFCCIILLTAAMSSREGLPRLPEIRSKIWFNADENEAFDWEALKGKAVLVFFWTGDDSGCKEAIRHVNEWYALYHNLGLEVIGINSPEYEFYATEEGITKWIRHYKIRFPVALDQDYTDWRAWEPCSWPAFYLIDRDGAIRATYCGSTPFKDMKIMLKALVDEGRSRAPSRRSQPHEEKT